MAHVKTISIDFSRVFDILSYQQNRYPNSKAVNRFVANHWQAWSLSTLREKADQISIWLLKNGIKSGDMILIIPQSGTPEWLAIDMACQQIGLIQVIIYPTTKTNEIEKIISETNSRMCICADLLLYEKINSIATVGFAFYHLIEQADGFFPPLAETNYVETQSNEWRHISSLIKDTDTFCIIYTSGSTGESKGVMLTHANIVFNIKSILSLLPIKNNYRAISFLPFSHIFERVTCYTYLAFGISIYFSEERTRFTKDFRTIHPHLFTTVPRVLEKMYEFIEARLESSSTIIRWFMNWAIDVIQSAGTGHSLKLMLVRFLVLNKWKNALGGKIKFIVVGASALRPDIGKIIAASGIKVIEGYGMTEMGPLIAINRTEPGMQKWGTVGKVIPGVDIHIEKIGDRDEGEIWVKGPNLMKGYFNKPKLTDSVFTDKGWFMTGDIGKFDTSGFLQITDRKKDLFKTSSGKYIAPMPLQHHFTKSHYIDKCLIIGFQKPYVTALLVPNFEMIENWCYQQKIHYTEPMYMVHNIKVKQLLKDEVENLNESLAAHERVRDFVICPKDWSVEDGSLTPTLKPIRSAIENIYQKEISEMYV